MSLSEFFAFHGSELIQLTLEHLFLVGFSTSVAVLLGVPLGIVLTRHPSLGKPVLGFANVMQTLPSLALFGFLIPLNLYLFHVRILGGIGARTAILALVLYALLPIIRNTFTGIRGIDPAIREAARGMGMTDRQMLFQVELPLSLGVIVAGIRVATVICVGTATIAAAIDAGGLGRYIFRGLRMNDNTLILAGAIPAALMALLADFILGKLERLLGSGRGFFRGGRGAAWTALSGLSVVLLGVVFVMSSVGVERKVAVGSKDFTEQLILGEILAQVIERKADLIVERRFGLGGNLAHRALASGEIDAYVEYTGTALMAILKERPLKDPKLVYRKVVDEYASRFGLQVTEPLGFDNTFAILVRAGDAERLNLKWVSQVAQVAPQWRAGFGQDFMSRPDGFSGFVRTYGLKFAEVREMDLSLTYRALASGQVDLIAGNSTDGLIARYDLVQLRDDRNYFPPYDAIPVVRRELLERYPEVARAFRSLGGLIGVQEMRRLNYRVDGEHRSVKEVVESFLDEKGLS